MTDFLQILPVTREDHLPFMRGKLLVHIDNDHDLVYIYQIVVIMKGSSKVCLAHLNPKNRASTLG